MQHFNRFTQAYSQAPWRKQMQMIGAFLLALIVVWIIAAIYLDVTARGAAIGRQVQEMQVRSSSLSVNASAPDADKLSIEELKQIKADLESKLAYMISDKVMAERAKDLGFKPTSPEDILYLEVPGYVPRQVAQLAPPPGANLPSADSEHIMPQTLGDWLTERLFEASDLVKGMQP